VTPALSVILPARNASRTILLAVRSTLADLPRQSELLVLNDGSTDDTLRKLSQVKDTRLRVLSVDDSLGVAQGLNMLIDECRSPIVARMDADDVTLRGRFSRQMKQLEKFDLVFSSRLNFGSTLGAFRPSLPLPIGPELMRLILAMTNPVPHSSLMARRELITSIGGYRPGSAEDYDLWLRLVVEDARLFSSAVPGIGYRMHPSQVTRSLSWRAKYVEDTALATVHSDLCKRLDWDQTAGLWKSLAKNRRERSSVETASVQDLQRFLQAKAAALSARQRLVFDLATR
jgi:glycosyltransferase involved in cell wall biosynthesis